MKQLFFTLVIICFANCIAAQTRILIDAGPAANAGGVETNSPDLNGNYWNNMTDARAGDRVINAITTTNIPTTVTLEVINRIDGTYNTSATGMNNANSASAVGIYPASATNDYAFSHNSVTNGRWRLKGLDPAKTYTIKFWGTKSFETRDRDIEIKQSIDTAWQSYSAASNADFNNAAYFTITGKSIIDFDIRTKANSIFGYINIIDINFNGAAAVTNQPPVANAGLDINITSPTDSAILTGCSSYDPENAPLKYTWRKISGNNANLSSDSICNPVLRNLTAGMYSFELKVTDTGSLFRLDTVQINVQSLSYDWPVLPQPICSQTYKIVTLGSSTTFGTGASPIDSSWVNKMRRYMQNQNAQIVVTNLGLGGLNTYQVNPSDYIPPAGKPLPDTARNITKAISLRPDAIIINLPTNDAASAFPIQETKDNLNRMVALADLNRIPVWVTTSQPRDNLSSGQTTLLVELRDWVNTRFGNKAVDFWTNIANANGTINSTYAAGDGVHLNNNGHHILFSRMLQEKIWDTICLRRNVNNQAPVARAGNDVSINLPNNSVTLSGAASSDADGNIISYNWRKYVGNSGENISSPNAAQTSVSFTNSGTYGFELTVTDNAGAISKDSVIVIVNPAANILPIARAGNDVSITLPTNSVSLSGVASSDADGNIVSYSWRKYVGNSGENISSPNAAQTSVSFTNSGMYGFELTVTENAGATSKDSVVVTVNPNTPPVANAGADKIIQLPENKIFADGRSSFDATGSIVAYQWNYVSGPTGSIIRTATRDTTSIEFIHTGTYIFRLTVKDNGNLSASDDIQVTVNATTPSQKIIKVNLFNGSVAFSNAQWNNWLPSNNVNSFNFKYEDGSQSTVKANLSVSTITDNGSGYASTATICPPEVLRFNSQHNSKRTLAINGLIPVRAYNFQLYASKGSAGSGKTIFRNGNTADTIDTDLNINDAANLNNMVASNIGRIVITITSTGVNNYLAGFKISETTAARILFTDVVHEENNFVELYPNPFKEKIMLDLKNVREKSLISIVDLYGRIILTKTFFPQQGQKLYVNTSALPKGQYFVSIVNSKNKSFTRMVKL